MHPRDFLASQPDKPAVIMADTGEALSFRDIEERGNQGAHLLRARGLANGGVMAIWLPNGLDYFETYWAGQRAGLYIVPISTALTSEEAAYLIANSGASLLVASGDLAQLDDLLDHHRPDGLAHVLYAGAPHRDLRQWRAEADRYPTTPIVDEQQGFHMVYSSGTTGRPKGVRLPLSGGPADGPDPVAAQCRSWYDADETTVYLTPAPMYHTAPLAVSMAIQRLGGTVILLRKFDPEAALSAIEHYRVTLTQMVPTMFIRLLRLPAEVRARYDLSSLKAVVHAAAPCPVEVKQRMIDWQGPILLEYYGGSEGAGSTFITSEEWLRKPGSVGRASMGVLHICGEDGRELPAGETGTIYFEGGWDFEYLGDAAKTAESRHPDHPTWKAIGDIGYVDGDGYLFLTDRKSFMIISGGVNIYPQETENLLATFPGVADVAVIGVPNAEMGEEVKAVVEPIDWADATPAFAESIVAYCRAHLSSIKAPRSVDFVEKLPRLETGKLYKRLIRDRYWAGHDRRIN